MKADVMQAIVFDAPGGPDVLHLATIPIPAPGLGEVLLRVEAAGVNRPEVLLRQGRYPIVTKGSPVLGLEAAGSIAALGPGVSGWKVGDAACALLPGGGYAQYAIAPVPQLLPIPQGYDPLAAACLPETFMTVWANLFQMGKLQSGEAVLIHGGAGGIGTTAIQLASAHGATVLATVRGADARLACEALGAAHAIDTNEQDFENEVKRVTGGRGVDVILDIFGAAYFHRNLGALAMDGRLILLGFLGGERVDEVDLTKIMAKRAIITGSAMRPRSLAEKGNIASDLVKQVWPLLSKGVARPRIASVFSLADAADAHRMMEAGGYIGKIVLRVSH